MYSATEPCVAIPVLAASRMVVLKPMDAAARIRFSALRRSRPVATAHLREDLGHITVNAIELVEVLLVEHDVALVE